MILCPGLPGGEPRFFSRVGTGPATGRGSAFCSNTYDNYLELAWLGVRPRFSVKPYLHTPWIFCPPLGGSPVTAYSSRLMRQRYFVVSVCAARYLRPVLSFDAPTQLAVRCGRRVRLLPALGKKGTWIYRVAGRRFWYVYRVEKEETK